MDKTAIKNFAIWARKKLIGDISYKASLLGITPDGIRSALLQSTREIEFYDIGLQEPYAISGKEIEQRRHLAELIRQKEQSSDYATAYNSVIEEVAYTWFNRLIAVRFMEVNDYLPSHTRILSSDSKNKLEPDIVTNPFDTELTFTEKEKEQIIQWQHENAMDSLFMLLFIKACNALNELLPKLFEKTADYTELLLNLSVTDRDGVVYHLVSDIPEEDFDVEQGGQVEIIGWLYQYYNAELKDETFALLKKNVKITKERIPSATQLFTPDWIVRYMVENSLGRLWVEGHPNAELKANWKYYLEEAEQEPEVEEQLKEIRKEYASLNPEKIRCMDPCMGSGHILVYMFDVLMQIYGTCGYTMREAAASIVEHNLWGLDIDERAAQLAYFSVMMKARQYDRRFFSRGIQPHVYAIHESNALGGSYQNEMGDFLLAKEYQDTLNYLLEAFIDAKEYGSILQIEKRDYEGLQRAWRYTAEATADTFMLPLWQASVAPEIPYLIDQAIALTQKYHVVVTNPPYINGRNVNSKIFKYLDVNYPEYKYDLFSVFIVRCSYMASDKGKLAFLTPYVWMFIQSYEKLRFYLCEYNTIESLIQFEYSAFEEATVPICTFSFTKLRLSNKRGVYLRLTDFRGGMETQRIKTLEAVANNKCGYYYEQSVKNFKNIPGNPIAYWVNPKLIQAFVNGKALSELARTRQGLASSDNNRFLKFWWEPCFKNIGFSKQNSCEAKLSMCKWFPCNKGGEYRKWYGNNLYIVNWKNDGEEMLAYAAKLYGSPTRTIKNIAYYFMEGMTWGTITSAKLSMRHSKKGFIPEHAGGMIPLKTWGCKEKYLLGLMNSNVAMQFLTFLSPTLRFTEGPVGQVPVIYSKEKLNIVSELVDYAEMIAINEWDSFETSWDFKSHPLVPLSFERKEQLVAGLNSEERWKSVSLLSSRFVRWERECNDRFGMLKKNEEELNRIFIDIYGLQDELTPDVEDKDVTVRKADLQRDIRSLISYAVGCMFGRYSIDRSGLAYAGGEWDYDGYTTFKPDEDNVVPITDEDYFDDDIVGVFCKWLATVYGKDTLEENLDFIAKALGNAGNTSREIIRNYFLKDFYKDHCKIYQKRPIYWLFDSGKQNGFKALIYLHRYNRDTIGNMRAEYLHRMEHVYESEINRMNALAEQSELQREAANARKRAEKLQKQLRECREYDEKVGHLAIDRIELDLDDGVKVNYEKLQTDRNGNKYQILAKI